MQKVFRLLRHNTESGPFTIGELLQQQIGPDDLIWVDGESTAWAHPQEMENLKYALSPNDLVKKAAPKVEEKAEAPQPDREIQSAIHISPAVEIERKAEELRQRTLSFKKTPGYEPAAWAHQEHAPILPLAESDIEISYHKKKGLPVGEVLMGAMVISLLTLGWYGGGKNLFRQPKELASAVAVRLTATEENAANGSTLSATDTAAVAINHIDSVANTTTAAATPVNQPQTRKETIVSRDTQSIAPKEEPATAVAKTVAEPVKKEEEKPGSKQIAPSTTSKEEIKTEPVTLKTAEESAVAEPEEKKKGFHLFKGLFKKKKKDDDKAEEETKTEGQ